MRATPGNGSQSDGNKLTFWLRMEVVVMMNFLLALWKHIDRLYGWTYGEVEIVAAPVLLNLWQGINKSNKFIYCLSTLI